MIGPARVWDIPPTTTYIMTFMELAKVNMVGMATMVETTR